MSKQLQCIDQFLPVGSLNSYIHWVNQISMLLPEEEQDLANKLIKNNDLDAARKLVLSHLRWSCALPAVMMAMDCNKPISSKKAISA